MPPRGENSPGSSTALVLWKPPSASRSQQRCRIDFFAHSQPHRVLFQQLARRHRLQQRLNAGDDQFRRSVILAPTLFVGPTSPRLRRGVALGPTIHRHFGPPAEPGLAGSVGVGAQEFQNSQSIAVGFILHFTFAGRGFPSGESIEGLGGFPASLRV